MAIFPSRKPPPGDQPPVQFSFTKQQIGLLAGGALVLLTISFSLGFVVADRRGGEKEGSGEVASGVASGESPYRDEREATVRIAPSGDKGGTTSIKPSFYKRLLSKENPETEKLDPLKLSGTNSFSNSGRRTDSSGGGMNASEADGSERKVSANKAKKNPPPKQFSAIKPRVSAKAAPPASKPGFAGGPRSRFTIQVLSVREPARAISVMRGLRDKGFYAFIQRVDLKEKGVWLRIRVGRFPDRGSASRTLQALRAKTTVQGGHVIPL
jgi:cell division septation protein DedD